MKILNDVGLSHLISKIKIMINKKADKEEIPTKVGQLTNDKNYVTQTDLGEAGLGDMLKSVYDTNNNGIVDRATVADSSNTAKHLICDDTRTVDSPPSAYMSGGGRYVNRAGWQTEFKSKTTIGVSNFFSGTYVYLETKTPWSDPSGGYPIQIVYGNGNPVFRVGISTLAWSEWKQLASIDNIPTKFTWGQLRGV